MRKKVLICHPDVELDINVEVPYGLLNDLFDVRTNKYMEKYRETGRYILPDGSCVLPEDVKISDRFTEYGYEDIWYLLWSGVITKEKTALFYIMEDPTLLIMMEDPAEIDLYNPELFYPLEPW